MAWEFDVWQSHAAHEDLIGADGVRRFKAHAAGRSNNVILVNAIAADADGTDQHAVFIERHAAGKNLCAISQGRQYHPWQCLARQSAHATVVQWDRTTQDAHQGGFYER